ncbi:MAG: hypothetical protein H6686_11815 [Fibrobacteria bacterium]|nr:hypothetical protein [Fibrobacteria bacterium]
MATNYVLRMMSSRIALVVPPSDRFGRVFETSAESGNRDRIREPFREVRNAIVRSGGHLETLDHWGQLDDFDLVVFHVRDLATLAECYRRGIGSKTVYLAWEPPVVVAEHTLEGLHRLSRSFGRILTWNPDLVDGQRFLELCYPHFLGPLEPSPIPFEERGLVVNLSANKVSSHPLELYSARRRWIEGLERLDPGFELWGSGWGAAGFKSWKGLAESKREVYHRFRFALCLENMRDTPGYATEKLFDALAWGVVPVYQGDPVLTRLLPSSCWVDAASFSTPQTLFEHLRSWTKERHEEALETASEFLSGPRVDPWRPSFLASQLLACADLARSLPNPPDPPSMDRLRQRLAWVKRKIVGKGGLR